MRVVQPVADTLQGCFDVAIEEYFDPLYYDGIRDRLSKFRNYCVRRTYLQAAGSTSLTFDCEATGVPEKYLYGSTSLIFGCTATGEVSAGSVGGNDLIYGSTSLTFGCSGTLVDKPPTVITHFGALYNYYAIETGKLLPSGWHIPTMDEILTLETTLGGSECGDTLKEVGYVHWDDYGVTSTNSSGLTLRGSGSRMGSDGGAEYGGIFSYIKESYIGWLSTDYGVDPEYKINMQVNTFWNGVSPSEWGYGGSIKNTGLAIRAIKDDSDNPGSITDYDGNIIPTVKIGDQVWTGANWMCTHYTDGTPITNVTNNAAWAALTTEAYCYYDNDPTHGGEVIPIPQIRTASGSTSLTFTLSGKTPPASYPAELHAVQLGAGLQINVDWEAVTDATGYLLQRIPQNYNGVWIPNWKSIYSGSNLTFADHIEDEGVMIDDTHVTYRIFAYNDSGYGPMSPEYIAHWYA